MGGLQISGGPSWTDSERFDLEAKADGTHTKDELQRMLQPLLAERFGLAIRRESKPMQVYALTVDKKSPNLQVAQPGRPTGIQVALGKNDSLQITGQSVSMTYLANYLAGLMRRLVLDRTGLQDSFDFQVESPIDTGDVGGKESMAATALTNSLPQLGLSLKSQSESVEILVIERAEKPSEN